MADLLEIVEALATALQPIRTGIPDLQIYPYWLADPTPPAIDIYPGDPFATGTGYGVGGDLVAFTVRARVGTADQDAGQRGLMQLLDPNAETSVTAALLEDQTLGGLVDSLRIPPDGISGYRVYVEDVATNGRLLGAEWRVEVMT